MKNSMVKAVAGCIMLSIMCIVLFAGHTVAAEQQKEMICGDYAYILQEDGTAAITQYLNFSQKLTYSKENKFSVDAYGNRAVLYLPEELDGHPVTCVAGGAFNDYAMKLIEADIYIPNTIVDIDGDAFGYYNVNRFLLSPSHPVFVVMGDFLYEKEDMRLVGWTGSKENGVIPDSLTIPEDTRIIGSRALMGVPAKEVVLPESLECIEDEAFYQSAYLEKIIIPDGVWRIGEAAFCECVCLCEVTMPQNLRELGNSAFYMCLALEQIDIPAGVKVISPGVFAYCTSLQRVNILSGVEIVDDGAFFVCQVLEIIELPSTVKHVGAFAFAGCSVLEDVHLPNGLLTLGEGAFSGSALKEISLPDSLTDISVKTKVSTIQFYDAPFGGCSKLERIFVSEDHPVFTVADGALIRKMDNCLLLYPDAAQAETCVVPEGVVTIGRYAFAGNQNLQKVIISEGVTTIEDGAFEACQNLQELTLPLSLECRLSRERLANGTYLAVSDVVKNCSRLKKIYITEGISQTAYYEHEREIMSMLNDACIVLTAETESRDNFYLVPYVLTEEEYKHYTGQMTGKAKKQTTASYKKISADVLERMNEAQRERYLDMFPTLIGQEFCVLKEVKKEMKLNMQEHFANIGYTEEAFEKSLKYINPKYITYVVKGDAEKKCEYRNGLLQPVAYIANEKLLPIIESSELEINDLLLDRYGLPLFKTSFRQVE